MGLFKRKQKQTPPPVTDGVDQASQVIYDEKYRDELRQIGRDHLKKIINESTLDLKQDIAEMMDRVSGEARDYVRHQLDATVSRLNSEITNQLNERIGDYSRISAEAQELVIQSLSRNAQMVYEKYQQMTANLQQVVANQEVMMVSVFQDNKSRVMAVQSEQDEALKQLRESIDQAKQETEQLSQAMRHNISQQATRLNSIYQENLNRVNETHSSQAATIETLSKSTKALERQYQELAQLLDKTVAEQKARVSELINENMAQIVEHYLVGALGEQSDLRSQIPSILESMEKNKQAMVEDMNL